MKILSFAQLKSAEQSAVNSGNDTFCGLMEKAGNSAAEIILSKICVLGKKINIVCGSGNNGGDGLVIAKKLYDEGADVVITVPFGLPSTDTARNFYGISKRVKVIDYVDKSSDVIIDALFGIGLNRPPKDLAETVIADMNKVHAFKVAVDIPSGIYCDGGRGDTVFKADLTVTFIAYKSCFFLPDTSSYCGEIVLSDIGVKPKEYMFETIEKPVYRKRNKNAHKGSFGTAFLICGSYGMCGAEILSAKAAVRSGVGLVKAVVCDKNYTAFTQSVPEAVVLPVETAESGANIVYERTLLSGLTSSSSCLVGCGIGKSEESLRTVKRLLELSEIPTVVDADGINLISKDINIIKRTKAPLILTPHPAEMARLCDTTVSDIEHNRIRYAKTFAQEYGCVLVLKGANTIVASPEGKIYFNLTGNAGMATAGSGDVLSGIIVSLLAQGKDILTAALEAVYYHGAAGDIAAEKLSERYMNAEDIIEGLKFV